MSAPLPPSDIGRRSPRTVILQTGTILHRFHTAAFAPIHFDRSRTGRLNAPNGAYGVLYAAKRLRGAFAETFLRTPGRRMLDPGLQRQKAYATMEVSRPVVLIDFDGPGLAILGATAEVVHGSLPYECPQAWSAALHAHPAAADGIAYTARHDPHETCYAVFERGRDAIREQRRVRNLDADWFWHLAEAYAVGRAPT